MSLFECQSNSAAADIMPVGLVIVQPKPSSQKQYAGRNLQTGCYCKPRMGAE